MIDSKISKDSVIIKINKLIVESALSETPPGRLSEIRFELVNLGSFIDSFLTDIQIRKATAWLELRNQEGVKSDRMADRLWSATEDGLEEMKLRQISKMVDKNSSAINQRIRVLTDQARNVF